MNVKKLRTTRHNRLVRVRHTVRGTADRPRLHVFRSSRFIYAQIINDDAGKTVVAASEKELTKSTGTKTERAEAIGKLIAEKAKKAKVTKVCFDRGYYKYHGRVAAVAKAARAEGLEF
jgi:large subunit ribosomal protein L18